MTNLDTIRRSHRLPLRALPALRQAYAAGIADARVAEDVPGKPGRKPYGSEPGEEEVVALMVRWRKELGWSWVLIADEMNERKLYRRNGTPWTAAHAARIVRRLDVRR